MNTINIECPSSIKEKGYFCLQAKAIKIERFGLKATVFAGAISVISNQLFVFEDLSFFWAYLSVNENARSISVKEK